MDRRSFLTASVGALVASNALTTNASAQIAPALTAWKLRFASHLGLISLDTPLFKESVGGLDPVAHIQFAKSVGFAGVEDNFLKLRPVADQERIGRALEIAGIEMGAMVNNIESWNKPLWGMNSSDAREQLRRELSSSIDAAKRVNGRFLTTISGVDPRVPRAIQLANMAENLKRLAETAERAGVIMGIETLNDRGFPNMLVNHIGDAYQVVKAVGSPAVKLIFDIFHIQVQDGDVITYMETMIDEIGLVQVADNPGRIELGTGELNWANVLRRLNALGYRGLVELEHSMSTPTAEGERAALARLRDINTQI
jgi:hydroxypyruvate isomerase